MPARVGATYDGKRDRCPCALSVKLSHAPKWRLSVKSFRRSRCKGPYATSQLKHQYQAGEVPSSANEPSPMCGGEGPP